MLLLRSSAIYQTPFRFILNRIVYFYSNHILLKHFFTFILLFIVFSYKAQQPFILTLTCDDNPALLKKITFKNTLASKTAVNKELQNILFTLYNSAYLAATIDSVQYDSLNITAQLRAGNIFKWAHLKKGNVPENLLSEVGFHEKLYDNKRVSYKDVIRVQEKMITFLENNGYPFASVKLDSIDLTPSPSPVGEGNKSEFLTASLNLQKGNLIKLDSIVIKGNVKITPAFIYNYIGIKPGLLYNESRIVKISSRIKELPFLRETKPFGVIFSEKENKLILFLEKKKASQFDGIIGFLPNESTGKILFTGDVHLKLQSALGLGELIDVNWRSLQKNTQDLKTHLTYPFLFSTPFGLDCNLKIYKLDTTFLDVQNNIGIQYALTGTNFLKAYYTVKKSSLLSTKGLEFVTVLPIYADVTTTFYGLGGKVESLDYRFNPRKGFSITANAAAGSKQILKNSKVNQLVYNNLKLSSVQYTGELQAAFYIPMLKRSVLKFETQSAFISGKSLFQNELFRIGGLKTLRGFDEESIRASAYSIGTLEYRYLFEQNSYLFFFADGAYYERNGVDGYVHDTPFGFGTGISFETKAGIFSLSYALGKQLGNPIYLRSGKIHFGIVNYF